MNIIKLGIQILIWLIFCNSCKKETDTLVDAGGTTVKLPHQWNISLSDDGELTYPVISTPTLYDGVNVLVGARKAGQHAIVGLNAITGSEKWRWQDLLSISRDPSYKDPIDIYNKKFHLFNGRFFFSYNTSSYVLDIETGQTIRKYKTNLARFDITSGIGDAFFTVGGTYEKNDNEMIYRGQLSLPQPETYLVTPLYKNVDKPLFNGFGITQGLIAFTSGRDTLISMLCYDQISDRQQNKLTTFSALYNLSAKNWIYDRAVMNSYSTEGAWNITLSGQNIYYNSMRELICYDVMTGNILWQKPFSQGFSSLLIVNGKLYGNNEDRYTYCFDPATGQQIWKEESSGTSSPLTHLNGVLYFLGGGDGKLHAIDANTGQHLWRVKSPDLDKNSGAWFYGVCVAVPGKDGNKGRIVATTGLNAYGYEAIR